MELEVVATARNPTHIVLTSRYRPGAESHSYRPTHAAGQRQLRALATKIGGLPGLALRAVEAARGGTPRHSEQIGVREPRSW